MELFAYSPRCNDDYDIFQLDECPRPRYNPRELRALRQLASLRESEVQNTDHEFRIKLNLGRCYSPEEVTISTDKKRITICAKHEEKEDKHGFVSRKMTRIYTLPPDVDPKSVTSTMNSDGLLYITACKQQRETPKEVPIHVEYTG